MNKKYFSIFSLLPGLKPKLSQQFHQSTQFDKFRPSPKKWPREWKTTFYKGYPRFPAFKLIQPAKLAKSFSEVLCDRQSTRTFSEKPLKNEDLCNILYYSAGENIRRKSKSINYRFYASGGARYPFEIYLIVRNVTNLKKGIYHYYIKENLLELLDSQVPTKIFFDKAFGQQEWQKAPVIFIITGIFERTQMKYEERGYRVVLMDLGHLSQNIYLVCSALNIGCCEINGFNDFLFNDLIDIDGLRESTLITFAIGNKEK